MAKSNLKGFGSLDKSPGNLVTDSSLCLINYRNKMISKNTNNPQKARAYCIAKCIYILLFSHYFFPLLSIQPLSTNRNIFISSVKNPLDHDVDLRSLAGCHYQNTGAQGRKKEI